MNPIGVGDIIKICEIAGRVYKNCTTSLPSVRATRANYSPGRDCTGEYKNLTTEARSLSNLLEDIQDKHDKIPESKRQQLEDAYEPCIEVLQELDKLLNHYNSLDTRSKRAWDRLKWDPEKSRGLRDRLTSSVTMLNGFYTSLIHDNQVLILEALERLEHDYKGGHREESIASLERITSATADDEDEEDEAAWTQILRDLEDVGVARQDALSYRDVIIDWLLQAVNEGRLLEQRAEPVVPVSLVSLPHDLEAALPELDTLDMPGTHHFDVPAVFQSYEANYLTPSWSSSPTMAFSAPYHQRAQSVPSAASVTIPEMEGTSSYAASQSSETDTSSLYARPEPLPKPPLATSASTPYIKINRVPVPTRSPNHPQNVNIPISPPATLASPPSPAPAPIPFISSPPLRPPPSIPQTNFMPPVPTSPVAPEVLSAPTFSYIPPAPLEHPLPPLVKPCSAPPLLQTPPSYYDKGSSTTVDLAWTSQLIIAAWSRHDFVSAGKHLEEQLTAVELGHRVLATGTQPDRRILRYLLGVCSSLTGSFAKAKIHFQSVFNGVYLNRTSMDDGDIAAARWLGDVCLHLREHCNAVLAWGVAHEGSIGRYGAVRDRTRRVGDELRLLDHWLFAFRRIENSFFNNIDPTDIFKETPAVEKSDLITNLKARLYDQIGIRGTRMSPPSNPAATPSYQLGARPQLDMTISEGFLLAPLISLNAWPLPWDSTFSPSDAVQLDRNMNSIRTLSVVTPLVERNLTSLSLGDSKKLHYVTKRGSQWLIESVKQGLQEMCIEHAEHTTHDAIICTINQHRHGYAFSEGIEIVFRKLPLRSIYGLKVSEVKWSTRMPKPTFAKDQDPSDFRDILKAILERAENEAASTQKYVASVMRQANQGDVQKYR
jgi:hypothetical protein